MPLGSPTFWLRTTPSVRRTRRGQALHGLVHAIGGTRIAAPPVGVVDKTGLDPLKLAERYRALRVGQKEGFCRSWSCGDFQRRCRAWVRLRLSALKPLIPACILLDVYHIFKGGSDFEGLAMFATSRMHNFHVNDYPADPPARDFGCPSSLSGRRSLPAGQIFRTLRGLATRGCVAGTLQSRLLEAGCV